MKEKIPLEIGIDLSDYFGQFWDDEKQLNPRKIPDGIYDVTGIPFVECRDEKMTESAIEFIKANPSYCLASAYETYHAFIFAWYPKRFVDKKSPNWLGSRFNYGSTNILDCCPKTLLILAEND